MLWGNSHSQSSLRHNYITTPEEGQQVKVAQWWVTARMPLGGRTGSREGHGGTASSIGAPGTCTSGWLTLGTHLSCCSPLCAQPCTAALQRRTMAWRKARVRPLLLASQALRPLHPRKPKPTPGWLSVANGAVQ